MTAEKLLATLRVFDKLENSLGLQVIIEGIRDNLVNLVNQPAHPPHQVALAESLARLTLAAARLAAAIAPSQRAAISDMQGAEFFDPSIAEKVITSIQTNAMTPSVAKEFVTSLAARRAAFLAIMRSTIQGLDKLHIADTELQPGNADLAFLIPGEIFKNHLGTFAKELIFIDRLIQEISEGVTGDAEPVELKGLSSSIPTIALAACLATVEKLATVVNKFLEAWERIQKLRNLKNELSEIGMKGSAVEELTEKITETVEEVVEESTEIIFTTYKKGDDGRKHELTTALKQDLHRLFAQIERGLTIEFRAEPTTDAPEDVQTALQTISNLSQQIKFPDVANEPMLLGDGDLLEGEIKTFKHYKKTTTQKPVAKKPSAESKQDMK